MAFYVKCDAHECSEVAPLTVKGTVFNPVNELPPGWRVIMWTAPAPEATEESPQKIAMEGLAEAVKAMNPMAGRGFAKFAQAADIGQQLQAMQRMEIRRSCVCPVCAAKLPLGGADVVGSIMPESLFPGVIPGSVLGGFVDGSGGGFTG
jgi:hypothetical protein